MTSLAKLIKKYATESESKLITLQLDNARLSEALVEVMSWIKNWNPEFIHDEEWDFTHMKVAEALATQPTLAESKFSGAELAMAAAIQS